MNRICVLGSINMDIVISVDYIPRVGETIIAHEQKMNAGGKGSNQAIAAARLGADVSFIGKLGNDDSGKILFDIIKNENIDVEHILIDENKPSGKAIIFVSKKGDNSIVVIPGSNMSITSAEIENCSDIIKSSDIIISQFEVPIDCIISAFKIAREKGALTVLNPAPARDIPDELLKLVDIIIPNETEASNLTGIEVKDEASAKKASEYFLGKGIKYVIITLGEKGAALCSRSSYHFIPSYKVKAIDSTAAGDAFIGALCSKLCKQSDIDIDILKESIDFANYVSSKVVQREGAVPSLPHLQELNCSNAK